MDVYVVNWNLNKEGDSYQQARQALLAQFDKYLCKSDPSLESTMFIKVHEIWNARDIYDHLKKALDDNDAIIISSLNRPIYDYYGSLEKSVIEWLES